MPNDNPYSGNRPGEHVSNGMKKGHTSVTSISSGYVVREISLAQPFQMTSKVFMDTLIPAWIDGTLTPFDKLETHRNARIALAIALRMACSASF